MSTVWIVVIVSGVGTLALKACRPGALRRETAPDRFTGVVGFAGPRAAGRLVAIGTFADGQHLVLDGRVLGVGAAAVAIRFRAPVLARSSIIAAAVTATAMPSPVIAP